MPSREDKIARPLSAPPTDEESPAPPRRAAAQFNWTLLVTVTNTYGECQFTDFGKTNQPQQFYRTRLGP